LSHDTVNQLLLHGAQHHDRDGVFMQAEGDRWAAVPDWRADRHSIRIALALRERLDVGPGDVVAMSMPLRLEWPLIERAIWGLGATSLPVRDSGGLVGTAPSVFFGERGALDIPDSVRAVVSFSDGSFEKLMDDGGVLDTPERATHFRALAKEVPPEAIASIDEGRESTHATWMVSIERFQEQHPPEKGRTYRLGPERTDVASRVALYAGWGDGLTRTALGPEATGLHTEGFVTLSQDGGV